MVVALWQILGVGFGLVDGVAVEGCLGHDVVEEECLEVLEAVGGEEEGVDLGAEFAKGKVGGREEGAARVVGAVELLEETGLAETEL